MLIQNTNKYSADGNKIKNHGAVIKEQFQNAKKIKLLVSYIKDSGFYFLAKELKQLASDKNKEIQIICSLDMDITSLDAIQKLIDIGIEVKHYEMNHGTFHPKVWYFMQDDGYKTCIIGSANFTLAALRDNVEAGLLINSKEQESTILEAENFFNYLWNDSYTKNVNNDLLQLLIDYRDRKKLLIQERNKMIRKLEHSSDKSRTVIGIDDSMKIILDFIYYWIELGIGDKSSTYGQLELWRGWYVMPDHGPIDDERMRRIKDDCASILSEEGNIELDISKDSSDLRFDVILKRHLSNLSRNTHKMSIRDLFIRQVKNYLINLNLCYHPINYRGKLNKNVLILSDYGIELVESKSIDEMKKVYTTALRGKMHLGMPMLDTVTELLTRYGSIDFNEFSLFVKHILSKADLDAAITIIGLYRQLSPIGKEQVITSAKQHFDIHLTPKAKGVHMNYEKNVRHTMSVFGWCEGMSYKGDVLSIET